MNAGSLSPKVTWPLFVGLFLSSVLTNFALITPDMLSWLGPWAPFAYGTVFSLLGFTVGYFKTDPVRELGKQAAAAPAAPAAPLTPNPAAPVAPPPVEPTI